MENTLIQIYLFVCQIYDTRFATCFQRASSNSNPRFTDQELVCIWIFGHLNEKFTKRQIFDFIQNYWSDRFPLLPAYQTFSARLNLLEPTFQSIGAALFESLHAARIRELDHLIDSFPVMLASGEHAFTAKVARDAADIGLRCCHKDFLSRCPSAPAGATSLCSTSQSTTNLAL